MAARRVLITGAGSGIGKGIAAFLSCNGPKHGVIITDLQQKVAEAAAEEIRSQGGNVVGAYELDVSQQSSIEALMEHLKDTPPEVLVNNVSLHLHWNCRCAFCENERYVRMTRRFRPVSNIFLRWRIFRMTSFGS